ncbi:MAG: acyl-CoA thioesterase [Mycobacterium sp.]
MTHPFDTAVALESSGGGTWQGRTEPAYANMVGPFGGITAATLLRAVELERERRGEPLSLTVNFLAPVADGAFEITTRCIRTNRTNQHWLVELAQGGEVKTNATTVFALRRDTWSDTEFVMPQAPAPETVAQADGERFVAWFDNYDMRFVEGAIPEPSEGPGPSSVSTLWVRDTPSRELDFTSLTAMCDVLFPRVFLRLGRVLPAGTISMTVYFHADADLLAQHGTGYVLASAQSHWFSRGYFDQRAELWSAAGTALATSHQIVYYKA